MTKENKLYLASVSLLMIVFGAMATVLLVSTKIEGLGLVLCVVFYAVALKNAFHLIQALRRLNVMN